MGTEGEGKHNFQASKDSCFFSEECNMVIEAIENSPAAMLINQGKQN